MDSNELKSIIANFQEKGVVDQHGSPVVVRHGEHRMNFKYDILNVEYDTINHRIVIVTGERVD